MKMDTKIKIVEVYQALQGEGPWAGCPVLIVRLSGCTRNCDFCDTAYHKDYEEIFLDALLEDIEDYAGQYVLFTGGEPLLQFKFLVELWQRKRHYKQMWHLESNGDLVASGKIPIQYLFTMFRYICFSPKEVGVAQYLAHLGKDPRMDIKVVSDLENVGVDLLSYATMVMPLTTGDFQRDLSIRQKVWEYCLKSKVRYSPRLHMEIFGDKERKV